MSTNLNYKQVANVTRRTWDTETYEKKAKARQDAAADKTKGGGGGSMRLKHASDKTPSSPDDGEGVENFYATTTAQEKEEFVSADRGAAGPEGSERAFLKARKSKVDLDSKIGTSEIITAEAAATVRTGIHDDDGDGSAGADTGVVKTGVGWHCRVCDCFLKDSHTYLDHINGRKHQRKLGFSMRVERSSKDQLLRKLNQLTKKKEEEQQNSELSVIDYSEMVKSKDEEARRRKEDRQRKRLERKKRLTKQEEQPEGESEKDDGEEEVEAEIDPALAAMMGFGGFGKKN